MNIVVINGSPSGESSITLQTVLYIREFFPDHVFTVLDVGQRIKSFTKNMEPVLEALAAADLILFCYPVYTFLVPVQLTQFIRLVKESGVDLSGKYATQISTSKHFYDTTAHRFIEDNCEDLGLKVIRGLSADMEDLLTEKGQQDAIHFWEYVLFNIENGYSEPARNEYKGVHELVLAAPIPEAEHCSGKKVALVADLSNDTDGSLRGMCARFQNRMACKTVLIDIGAFPFAGGCLGCFNCASDGTCIYKDGFDTLLRDQIQTADAIVYAFSIQDHSMGVPFKFYDDRQFCNGHRTVTMGRPVGYLVNGHLSCEENLRVLLEARAQVGGNFLAGIASNEKEPDIAIDHIAETLLFAMEHSYNPPANFYGVGGMKIFRDLIYQMRGLMRADHRFFKEHHLYDYPQRKKGTILGMYFVGAMMNNKTVRKKMGGKMTEGMLMPYQKVLEKARQRNHSPNQ